MRSILRDDYTLGAGAPDVLGGGGRREAGPMFRFPAELFPPDDSTSLILTDSATLAAVGSVYPDGLTYKVPLGYVAVIRQLQIFADAPTLTTRARWRIRVNGAPVQGLENVTMIFRNASSLARDFDTLRIEVPDGGEISVEIVNVDGVSRLYGAQLVGWQYQLKG